MANVGLLVRNTGHERRLPAGERVKRQRGHNKASRLRGATYRRRFVATMVPK